MALTRDIPLVVQSVPQTTVTDCADGGDSTRGAAINGSIVDRLALGRSYRGATPFAVADGYQSTEANRKYSIEVKMQHGASSGGGDMADFSTGLIPAATVFHTSADTTEMSRYSTGDNRFYLSNTKTYDLLGADRYLRVVVTPTGPGTTTSTAADVVLNVQGGFVLTNGDELPHRAEMADLLQNRLATATSTG